MVYEITFRSVETMADLISVMTISDRPVFDVTFPYLPLNGTECETTDNDQSNQFHGFERLHLSRHLILKIT